jgi:mono/diheme cytochrome c family protein
VAEQRSDGLGRWILGGLAAGAVILGLMVAAYAIGYDRGQDAAEPGPPAATTTEAETETAETTAPEEDPVAAGEALWTSTGCSGCHTIDGSASVGPTVEGLAGSEVELADGETVTADEDYLARSITDPDAQIVAGYSAGVMSAATDPQGFGDRPDDVEALVAYMAAQG